MNLKDRLDVILGLGFNPKAVDHLERYVDHLWKSNSQLNLFSRKMPFQELVDNHIVDCLLPLKFIQEALDKRGIVEPDWAEFGSGGGLPGVLYALHFSKDPFVLYEKSPKKRSFLESCASMALNLEVRGPIEADFGKSDKQATNVIVARAFKPIDEILELSEGYFKRGGVYMLLKGRQATIDEELEKARSRFKITKIEIIKLESPLLDVERHLVVIGI